MAFTSRGSWGTGVGTAAGTSTTFTTTGQADVDDLCIVTCAKDNTGTTDAASTEFTGCSVGTNIFTKAGEYRNSAGAANDGTVVAVYYCIINATVNDGSTVTVTHDSVADRAISAWRFSCTAQNINLRIAATPVVTDVSRASSISISNLVSKEYLFFRGSAAEDEAVANAATVSSGYTFITALPSTTASTPAVNQYVYGEFRILTATASTSAPTLFVSLPTQQATVFFAFEELPRTFILS